ncbi:MAG TPA: hypothetical protein VGJ54_06410 [Streptosporangiaceae bacterium]
MIAEVGEQGVGLLGEGGENLLLDLGVLGGMDNAVTHVGEELEVVLVRLGSHEQPRPGERFGQADCPDLRGNGGPLYAQQPDQRAEG